MLDLDLPVLRDHPAHNNFVVKGSIGAGEEVQHFVGEGVDENSACKIEGCCHDVLSGREMGDLV